MTLTLPDGSHVLSVRATGVTTGPGAVASTSSFVVDAAPPVVVIDEAPARRTTDSPVKLVFHSDDPTATFQCRVNGDSWNACTSPATFHLSAGNHVLKVRAVSPLTGTGPNSVTGSFTVSRPGPRVVIDSAPTGTVAAAGVLFAFSSPDTVDHFECALEDGKWVTCTSPASFAVSAGQHVLSVRAVGARNVVGTPAVTEPFIVETTSGQALPVDAESVADAVVSTDSAAADGDVGEVGAGGSSAAVVPSASGLKTEPG